ncbi:unnamed protein product [Camellia sinensis]
MVMVEASDPPQLETIGEQILKRCGGVPPAIVLAAGLLLLRERSENAWKGIHEGMGQDDDQCSEIFGLSYKDLPTNLKPCFLYFGLFPEDHEISAFNLVNLWAAEGFIRGSGVREVEDVGDDYLNHLIGRNLIQVVQRRFDGKVRSCCIHDILHDLCIREAKEIYFFNTQNDVITCNCGTGVRRVTTHGGNFKGYISLNYRTPKLRSMLSFSGNPSSVWRKMVKNFLRDFELLRVLSVKCDYLPRALPNEVGNLKNLHFLGLGSRNYIEIPHTISKQQSESLYGLKEKVWGDFSFLHKLVNLRRLGVYSSERIIEILSDPTLVLAKLEKLLSNIEGEISRTCNLSQYDNLLSLKLRHFWGIPELPQQDKLPPNLTKLTLFCTYLQEDPMETLKKLPKLKILKLYANSYVGRKMVCPGAPGCNFPQLEVLKIYYLEELEELIVEEGGMPQLKELGIFRCNLITTVPDRIKNIMEIHKDSLKRRFDCDDWIWED